MRILIATVRVPFVRGGAEFLAEGLHRALLAAGHEAEIVAVPFKWDPPRCILDHMLACRLLDLTQSVGVKVDLLIGLKFPAYYISHPNKILWLLHQHRQAYDLWDHPLGGDLINHAHGLHVRAAVQQADRSLIPCAKAIYTISRNVAHRLQKYCGIRGTALYHPPPGHEALHSGPPGDWLFFPSRLTPVKRQELVLDALAHTANPVRVVFAGAPEHPAYLQELQEHARRLGLAGRVDWAGSIPDAQKVASYAGCLGVIYPPVDEDYGYVTLEAMLSAKPVITCTDSGGTQEFVVHQKTGLVTAPGPKDLAGAMDLLWEERELARGMGCAARDHYASLAISWERVVEVLTG